MSSIRISQLNDFQQSMKSDDFVALVDSSSMTTYRVSVETFGNWFSDSGSVSSASWASESISSDSSSFLVYPNTSTASFSQGTISASWAGSSSIAISSSFNRGTSSYANIAKSSSWANTSSVAITASYFNFSVGIPPFSDTSLSSSWASRSFAATSASWASASISSSYAKSASHADSSSFCFSASFLIPTGGSTSTKTFSNLGGSWWVANPGGAFVVDNDLYVFNYNRQTDRRNLVKINMQTNVATYKQQWPYDDWNWYGRTFRQAGQIHCLAFTNGYLYDYNVDADTVTAIAAGGYSSDLPVKIVTWPTATSGDFYCLYGDFNAGTYGNTPYFRWRRHYYSGGAWHEAWASANITLTSIVNNTELRKFYNFSTNPLNAHNTLLWDYNYLKKRYYLMDDGTGYMHILSQTTGDIDTSWLAASITYEKTLAVPMPNTEMWSNVDTEHIHVDYDPDTGVERGIIIIRRGNSSLNGSVTYVNWPENGNW